MIESIKDLKLEINEMRCSIKAHSTAADAQRFGLAKALDKIEDFEASVRDELNNVAEIEKYRTMGAELRRILGGEGERRG